MKLQLQNVGESTIVIKDTDGYTDFTAEVAKGETNDYNVSDDLLQRLAPQLRAMEELTKDPNQDDLVLVGLRWSVQASTDEDDRSSNEGLAGLPTLNELQAANYSTGSGASDAIAAGINLLGNQIKASSYFEEGAAKLDLEAVAPGAPGNAISVEIATPSGGAIVIGVAANKVTVTPPAAGDTVTNIVNAINTDAQAKLLVQAVVGAAGNITAAQAEKFLDGGVGPGVSLTLNGTACVLTEVAATQLTFDLPSGISAANRIIPLEYRNGPHISRLSVPVVA